MREDFRGRAKSVGGRVEKLEVEVDFEGLGETQKGGDRPKRVGVKVKRNGSGGGGGD